MTEVNVPPIFVDGRKVYPGLPMVRVKATRKPKAPACIHLGEPTGEEVRCKTCKRADDAPVMAAVYSCSVYGECTTERRTESCACCRTCSRFEGPNSAPA